MDSADRADFLANLKPNRKYVGIVGIYRHNTSADRIGIFDKQIIEAIAPTVKWIAHNGAGYDQIDVAECKAKGSCAFEIRLTQRLTSGCRHTCVEYPRSGQ
jgi:glyoxylate reductase